MMFYITFIRTCLMTKEKKGNLGSPVRDGYISRFFVILISCCFEMKAHG